MVGWSMSAKRNDEHTHKCDDWTEEYLVWKPELVKKPEVIYVSYLFILALVIMFIILFLPTVINHVFNKCQKVSSLYAYGSKQNIRATAPIFSPLVQPTNKESEHFFKKKHFWLHINNIKYSVRPFILP